MQDNDKKHQSSEDEHKSPEERELEEKESMPDSESNHSSKETLSIGIVPAPEVASDISDKLSSDLTERLRYYVDDNYTWNVEVVVDSYIGAEEDAYLTMKHAKKIASEHNWDYTVAITDIPLFKDGEFLVAEVDDDEEMAQISFPALGIVPLYRRVRSSTLQLISEMHHGTNEDAREAVQERIDNLPKAKKKNLHSTNSRELIKRGSQKKILPIDRVVTDDDDDTAVRYIARPKSNGYFRVGTGMVRANNPLQVIRTFKSVVAIAFATGAYALIFPTVWLLADAYELERGITLMVVSYCAMTTWIILAHNLWEKKNDSPDKPSLVRLHNLSTLFTIGLGVAVYYVVLFICFLVAVFLFIPPDLLESENGIGREAGLGYYIYLSWLITSLATVIGAIGAGLEDEETVLKGTYGYRQRKRKEYLQKLEDNEEDK
ncbi:hypothetical protein [Salipaludibacillus daqingensis]|uniref:hypothetical protein n=1 Tax=Salipaludibacillus daqingensis TaxID=3041001 RepID=UPI002476702F|nr:hypothetical protein [Salipaludibacillus daqingensis]